MKHIKDHQYDIFIDQGKRQSSVRIGLTDDSGSPISVQHPLPSDGDSIYVKDLDLDNCDNYNFSGSVSDYFDSLTTVNNDITAISPKKIKIWLKRTIYTSALGIGCNDLTGSFSNVKIELLGSGGVVRNSIDLSSDDTKYNSKVIEFEPTALNGFTVSFLTTDDVCLSNMTMRKAVQVESQIKAVNDDGMTVNIGATDTGNLKVANVENGLSIAQGKVINTSFVHKFGEAPDFLTSDGTVSVWDGANTNLVSESKYVYSTTDDIDSISSSSAADTQVIEIQGLDINYAKVTQSITLQGQTTVTLPTPLIRIFRMKNVGSVDIDGVVYCYTNVTNATNGVPNDSTATRAVINNGNNQTLMAIYTIPAGNDGYMRDWYSSTSGAKKDSSHQMQMVARPFEQVFQLKHKSSISFVGTSYIQHRYNEPEYFSEKTDIEMRTNTDQDDAGVSAGFDIVLVNNG